MREITLTCPFTGLEFNALELDNGDIQCTNPLTDNTFVVGSNQYDEYRFVYLPFSEFEHKPIVKAYDAKEILDVSKQRIAQIINSETIPVKRINKEPYFLKADVLEYRENRQVGAPRKEK